MVLAGAVAGAIGISRKDRKMEFRTLAEGLQFPEGPVAIANGSVLLVEIAAGTLTRIAPDGTKSVVATTGGGPNGAAIGPDGKCYVANNGGFEWHREEGRIRPLTQAKDYSGGRLERVDLKTGAVEPVYRACGDMPLKGPNDLVIDAAGGGYFTHLRKRRPRRVEIGAGYYPEADGSSIVEVAYPMVTPNGIGLSPDEKTLYVAETEAARLWAFPIDAPGVVKKQPWPSPHGGRLVAGMGGYQSFDSLAVQAGGRVCGATLVHGGNPGISSERPPARAPPRTGTVAANIRF